MQINHSIKNSFTFIRKVTFLFIFLLINITSVFSLSEKVTACNCNRVTDSLELVNFYEQTNGNNWVNHWNFNQPVSEWYGISLDQNNQCVEKINLGFNQLSGNLTDLNFPSLIELNLVWNNVNGTIPNFNHLPQLERLLLTRNNFLGTIPNFNHLPNLLDLWLDDNDLVGEIPDFSNLANLEYLNLHLNQLSGEIPNFTNLPKLISSYLYSNQLSGVLPDFSNLPMLQILGLGDNQLSGSLPLFTHMENLKYLYLEDNKFSGEIPTFSFCPNLVKVNLDHNQFNFCPNLEEHPNIQQLTIHENKLTFDDIIPNVEFENYISQDSLIEELDLVFLENDIFIFDLDIDQSLSNNTYHWYKNNQIFLTTNECTMILNNLNSSDEGSYHCIVTNPNIPDLSLKSHSLNITITNINFPDCTESSLFINSLTQLFYHIQNNITSTAKIATHQNVIFKAGEVVSLEAGFEVKLGGEFSIEIEECEQ